MSEDITPDSIKVLNLRDSDILVIRYEQELNIKAREDIKQVWTHRVGVKNKIVILDGGATIDVLRPDASVMGDK